jgi:indole-3-glycerol phosphate synthase
MHSATMLDTIVNDVQRRLNERKQLTPFDQVVTLAKQRIPGEVFRLALCQPGMSLIAEVKRASPSKGALNLTLDPDTQAQSYARAGASAISVLTEEDHFKGSLHDLARVRKAVEKPLLRKDFIIDPYQIWEARAWGADAVLLIVAILDDTQLRQLLEETRQAQVAALVEVHNEADLARALSAGADIIGINNRNLHDFSVSLNTTFSLRPFIPPGTLVVSESGIRRREDVERLEQIEVDAVLIGEALVTTPDPHVAIQELLGR